MTVVAIQQPNYLPWLGYFHKIARADAFVFLDDVQFSKNGYINRVQILARGAPRWLTVPVRVRLGDPINAVRAARADWTAAHLDALRTFYGDAPAFGAVWPRLRAIYAALPQADLAAMNRALIEAVSAELDIACRFVSSADVDTGDAAGDERLVRLVNAVAPGATYLSGQGGAKYQDPEKFRAGGLGFRYAGFRHPVYEQGASPFVPGLSVVDALFRLGWRQTAGLIGAAAEAA